MGSWLSSSLMMGIRPMLTMERRLEEADRAPREPRGPRGLGPGKALFGGESPPDMSKVSMPEWWRLRR